MLLLVLLFCFCTRIDGSGEELTTSPDPGVRSVRRKKNLAAYPSPLAVKTKPQQRLEEKDRFDKELGELIGLIKETSVEQRKNHVVIFDVHGVLTTLADPSDDLSGATELANAPLVKLYHEIKDLGVTVVISSAWRDMSRVLQSLDKANIPHAKQIFSFSDEGYDIVHAGNVVSARESSRTIIDFGREADYLCKKEAAIWYANQQGIDEIASITLLDDRASNLQKFDKPIGQPASFLSRIVNQKTRFGAILVPDIVFQ